MNPGLILPYQISDIYISKAFLGTFPIVIIEKWVERGKCIFKTYLQPVKSKFSVWKKFFKNVSNSQEGTYGKGLRHRNLLKRNSRATVSCKFCEIFKNIFLTENHRTTASESKNNLETQRRMVEVFCKKPDRDVRNWVLEPLKKFEESFETAKIFPISEKKFLFA